MGYTKDLQIKHQFFCDMIGNQTSSYIIVYLCTSGVYLGMLALGKPKKMQLLEKITFAISLLRKQLTFIISWLPEFLLSCLA